MNHTYADDDDEFYYFMKYFKHILTNKEKVR